jgi:chromatin structure-remodeling complex protein RSC7
MILKDAMPDGRWVIDDYNEEKSMEEIAARGLRAGDPVGELQDTSTLAAEAALLAGNAARDAGKQERGGPSSGMYRAGGATTIFGGSGWGPYSEGPLNAVKKSMLSRDGVSEDNWMFIAAQRTLEMDEEWKTLRRAALKESAGLDASGIVEGEKRVAPDESGSELPDAKRHKSSSDGPLGVYEPQTGLFLCECFIVPHPTLVGSDMLVVDRSDTQPTRSRWEYVDNARPVLGGTKVGSGAWGLASVETVLELPTPGEEEQFKLEMLQVIMEES